MTERRCLVAVLPSESGDPDRLIRSVDAAFGEGLGDFREIELLPLPPTQSLRGSLAEAASLAVERRCGWLLAVGADETVLPDIFVKTAPALRLQDAVWGGASVRRADGAVRFAPITRLAAQDLVSLFHCALRWWIGSSHFVRPEVAQRALAEEDTGGGFADYMLALWRGQRVYKTAQALTVFDGAVPPVAEEVRARLLADLDARPVFMDVDYRGGTVKLPYTGRNAGIERAQTRGQFFEHEELAFLANTLPTGMRIVDAGANTGNHTVFFATAMAADKVHPIEPDGLCVDAIRRAVAANRLANVDLSLLGTAAGAAAGSMRAVQSPDGGLGATRLVPDPKGSVPVRRLDEMIEGRVGLLKIDVEGMEMAVLAGAQKILALHRPVLFVEVMDRTTGAFLRWADANLYRVEKLFPDKTHCNFVMVPDDR